MWTCSLLLTLAAGCVDSGVQRIVDNVPVAGEREVAVPAHSISAYARDHHISYAEAKREIGNNMAARRSAEMR